MYYSIDRQTNICTTTTCTTTTTRCRVHTCDHSGSRSWAEASEAAREARAEWTILLTAKLIYVLLLYVLLLQPDVVYTPVTILEGAVGQRWRRRR